MLNVENEMCVEIVALLAGIAQRYVNSQSIVYMEEVNNLPNEVVALSWCVSDAPGTPQGTPKTTYFGVIFWFHDHDEDDNSLSHEIWLKLDVSSLIFLKVRLCQTSISLENSRGFKGLAACDMGSKQGDEYKLSLMILLSFWGHFRAQNRSKMGPKPHPRWTSKKTLENSSKRPKNRNLTGQEREASF